MIWRLESQLRTLCPRKNTISSRDKAEKIEIATTVMFRRPRQTEPDMLLIRLSKTLQPLTVIPWGALAMWHLGVPIAVGVMYIFSSKTVNLSLLLLTILLSL